MPSENSDLLTGTTTKDGDDSTAPDATECACCCNASGSANSCYSVASAGGVASLGAQSIGALAIGAFSLGALAIGAVAIGRLRVKKVNLGDVRIKNLVVEHLEVTDFVHPE
jgi:hypothetical protein